MSKNIKLIAVIVLLILIGVFAFSKNKNPNNINPQPGSQQASIEGCYVAMLDKDVYTLTINQQNGTSVTGLLSYKNFEKDSSMGSFTGNFENNILIGDYEFDSEGMHSIRQVIFKKVNNDFVEGFAPVEVVGNKERFKDINAVTYDSKLTFKIHSSCNNLLSYTDPSGAFSLSYNPNFTIINGEKALTKDWKGNSTTTGSLLSTLYIYRTYMPGTNFSDAKLTIGRSNNGAAIQACLTEKVGEDTKIEDVNINGLSFKKMIYAEAAAGNRYEVTSYHAILDGDCYVIEYTIHSTNIDNYPSELNIKAFDKQKIVGELEAIVKSFKFLVNSD